MAYSCRDLNRKCTVTVPKGERHWLTNEAERIGANVIEVPMGYLTNIQHKARVYCEKNNANLIPFGGDHPIIIEAMKTIALILGINPKNTILSSSGKLIKFKKKL